MAGVAGRPGGLLAEGEQQALVEVAGVAGRAGQVGDGEAGGAAGGQGGAQHGGLAGADVADQDGDLALGDGARQRGDGLSLSRRHEERRGRQVLAEGGALQAEVRGDHEPFTPFRACRWAASSWSR